MENAFIERENEIGVHDRGAEIERGEYTTYTAGF
jgi:hypothetical protein